MSPNACYACAWTASDSSACTPSSARALLRAATARMRSWNVARCGSVRHRSEAVAQVVLLHERIGRCAQESQTTKRTVSQHKAQPDGPPRAVTAAAPVRRWCAADLIFAAFGCARQRLGLSMDPSTAAVPYARQHVACCISPMHLLLCMPFVACRMRRTGAWLGSQWWWHRRWRLRAIEHGQSRRRCDKQTNKQRNKQT